MRYLIRQEINFQELQVNGLDPLFGVHLVKVVSLSWTTNTPTMFKVIRKTLDVCTEEKALKKQTPLKK